MAAIIDFWNFFYRQKTNKIDQKVIYHFTWCCHDNKSFFRSLDFLSLFEQFWLDCYNFYTQYHFRISLFRCSYFWLNLDDFWSV